MNTVKTKQPHLPITLLLSAAFLIGCFVAPDYGLSWDEAGIFSYSKRLLGAYQYVFRPQDFQPDTSIHILNLYGPAHFLYSAFIAELIIKILPSWANGTAEHFVYFTTFLIGVLFLYLLALRWMSEWSAFGVALLFISQPLFWGHALMNPKDTPFMSLFIASVYLGLRMMDDPTWKKILAAGIALGFATSIRSLGPMAGALVLLYGLRKSPRGFFIPALKYSIVALIAAYLTWPYLWKAPIANLIESLEVMSQFPFDTRILFWGNLYLPDQLPRSYVPVLFALQLTEPALFLFTAGALVMLASQKWEPIALTLFWFALPVSAVILLGSVLYDNARQIFFLLPPMFIVTGFALEFLSARISSGAIKNALLLIFILPGLFAAIQLHPYEYAYYNSFVGGMKGASNKFDTDYWGISFKESMEYVNANAPARARILILSGPEETAMYYARPDLRVITEQNDPTPQAGYDYVLILTRKNQGALRCQKSELAHQTGRDGVIFAYVMKPGTIGKCR
jgi:hypothetical protein